MCEGGLIALGASSVLTQKCLWPVWALRSFPVSCLASESCFLPSVAASDYGMKLPILRSNPEDQILYQTERYNEETFGYEVPIKEEGDYVLVLKFAEVYFAQSQQKVGSVPSGPPMARGSLPHWDRPLLRTILWRHTAGFSLPPEVALFRCSWDCSCLPWVR